MIWPAAMPPTFYLELTNHILTSSPILGAAGYPQLFSEPTLILPVSSPRATQLEFIASMTQRSCSTVSAWNKDFPRCCKTFPARDAPVKSISLGCTSGWTAWLLGRREPSPDRHLSSGQYRPLLFYFHYPPRIGSSNKIHPYMLHIII